MSTPLTLRELHATFLRHESRREMVSVVKPGIDPLRGNWTPDDFHLVERDVHYHLEVDVPLAEAHGVMFLCPKCYEDPPRGADGTHVIICWFVGKVPDDIGPKPGRWIPAGTGIDDLHFAGPAAASVQSGDHTHFFVRHGRVEDVT